MATQNKAKQKCLTDITATNAFSVETSRPTLRDTRNPKRIETKKRKLKAYFVPGIRVLVMIDSI